MTKRIVFAALFIMFMFQGPGWAGSPGGLRISGVVKQPLQLTLEDLTRMQSIAVRQTEVDQGKQFHGVFNYRGIPLRDILELAFIEKEESDFFKRIDLAVVVRNKAGKQTVLSWGEVFYRNPAEIVIAYSSAPVMPYRNCAACHKPEVYQNWLGQLKRPVGLPKLVVANDFYTDRSLEEVVNIEIVDLNPKIKNQKMAKLHSPSFTVSGAMKTSLTLSDLSGFPHEAMMVKGVGEGMGYHGLKQVAGVPLAKILEKAGAEMDINSVCLISAPDGYRSLLSFGEIFLAPAGRRILICDRINNQPLEKDGKFLLIVPDDLAADRDVKAVSRIEIINLKKTPKVFVISMGCADTSLLTLEALSYLSQADAVVCSEDIAKRFAYYIGQRPVLFDPFKVLMPKPLYEKELAKLSHVEMEKLKEGKVAEAVKTIRQVLDQGRNVALLEYGDPSIFGSFRAMNARFTDQEKVFIPGLSAFNAANALIGREIACKGSIILTSPWSLKDNPNLLKAVAEKGDTLAIFMGLKEMKELLPLLQKNYPGSTPLTFAIRVGYSNSKRLIKTTLDKAMFEVEKENGKKESWLGMIYLGPCLP